MVVRRLFWGHRTADTITRASRFELLQTIMWPGIRADVLTGLRFALTSAWIILVPAEMLGVDSGLGYFILDSRDRFAYSDLVAAIVVIGALGFALDRLAHYLLTRRRHAVRRPQRARALGVQARTRGSASRRLPSTASSLYSSLLCARVVPRARE